MKTNVPGVRTLVVFATLVFTLQTASAQSFTTGDGKLEVGVGFGPMFFLGDLGGNPGVGTAFIKDVNLPFTKIAKTAFVSVYPTEWIGFRLALNHASIEADDSKTKSIGGPEQDRKDRNLKFQSNVWEAFVATEVYPTVLFMEYTEGLFGKLRPYGVIGIGAFRFNPKGQYYDQYGKSKWVELKPLRLEGQGMSEYPNRPEYSLVQMEIPMGAGVKLYLTENSYIGVEVLHRKTFTDYMDDVSTSYIDNTLFDKYLSAEQAAMANQLHWRYNFDPSNPNPTTRPRVVGGQRGDPMDNDAFFSTMVKFGWRLKDRNSSEGKISKQVKCPTFF
jgi:hypothetical protein